MPRDGPYAWQVQELYEQRFIPWFSIPSFVWFMIGVATVIYVLGV